MGPAISADGTAFEQCGKMSGPTVVLIHGLGLNRHIWFGFVPYLVARFRVLSYDLIGHGDSVIPEDEPTLERFSAQLLTLLDTLAIEQAALVGFSLGGMINRRLAIDHPARCQSLVILNSPHERGAEAQRTVEARARLSAAEGIEASIEETLERWFTTPFRMHSVGIIDRVRRDVLANQPDFYAACRWTLATGVTELIRPQPPITLPTLVMTSEHDTGSTPAMSQSIAAEIPGSECKIVPGVRHMGLVEAPKAFAEPVSRFLARSCTG